MSDSEENNFQREDFNRHIWHYFLQVLFKKGNHIRTPQGLKIKRSVNFSYLDCENRNPKQVPDQLWKDMVARHLRQYNYN